MTVIARASKSPCLSDIAVIFPVSHTCHGRNRQRTMNTIVPTVLTVRNTATKNAGSACAGAVSGLTRKSTISSDVTEKTEAMAIPKGREDMGSGSGSSLRSSGSYGWRAGLGWGNINSRF